MILVRSLARRIIFGVPACPAVPLMSGHLQCTDTFAWSRGCPFMAGATVHNIMCYAPRPRRHGNFDLPIIHNRPFSRKRHCHRERGQIPIWWYVTMHIKLSIPEFTRNERNFHCDVLHITTDRVVRLFLDDAIAALQTSR